MFAPAVMSRLLAMPSVSVVAGEHCLAFYSPVKSLSGNMRELALQDTHHVVDEMLAGLNAATPPPTCIAADTLVDPDRRLFPIGCAVVGLFSGFFAGGICFAAMAFSRRGEFALPVWQMPMIVCGASAIGAAIGWSIGWLLKGALRHDD